MHYTTTYNEVTPEAKQHRALNDIRDYLGSAKFDELTAEFRKFPNMPLSNFANFCSLAGIEGYPVQVWFDYCFAK